jgi:HAD superfamily phosphoserine phosphatase-like hydrolase
VTATNEFVTAPIAQAFGIDTLIAVQLERDQNGELTGRIAGTPSFGRGKVDRLQQWLEQQGLTWEGIRSTFYSDSINDLPLLEKVNHPVATNPDARLRAVAQQRGWPILELFPTP